ncbi:diguanylate cyclase [Rhodoferax ferrireducens]|uniref:diguanylate cyclase n=1 Tax=Rhodoferax ferrireducens TaxID=192843 RepID=UPI000E0CC128|nr:diguanylate cyclase [Rhodoferax ferrireducens]
MNTHTVAEKPLSAREKIAKLRATFVAQLPMRIERAHALFDRLQLDSGDQAAAVELHRFFHSLKGTGRSFGFRELGAAAAEGEDLAAELLKQPLAPEPPHWRKRLGECLDRVQMRIAGAGSLFGSDADSADAGFTLPVSAGQTLTGKGARLIYVCDDEVLPLEQLASQLGCFGYEIVSFTEPPKLHEAMLARRPDAVIMDIHFPQGDRAGAEVLEAIRRETGQAVPAIFLSARNDFAARLIAVQAGSEAYFHKPARAIELVAALDALTQQQPDPYRILLIDDEPGIASYHSIILQEAGMVTHQISEPSRVLEVLQEFRPDMVLMDMYMPECSGRDLARLIRQVPDYVSLPIVYLSSETDRQKQFSAMRIGAEGFLTKPVIPEDLVTAVVIRAERMRTLRSLMARDSMTGLFNHTTTTQLLENAVANAGRGGGAPCFAMIDIDHFKRVNDTHGHAVGDQVIQALARILQQRLRNSDVVGRYGGEEFAVILQDVPVNVATRLIEDLRQDFSRVLFHSANGNFSCTFSAGIASYAGHRRAELLREAADKALYEAKRSGRNCVVLDSHSMAQDTK